MDRVRVASSSAGLTFLVIALCWVAAAYPAKDDPKVSGISPEKVAGFVHAVLQAHRTIYTTHIVNRLQEKGVVMAVEHWEQENALPLVYVNMVGGQDELVFDGGSVVVDAAGRVQFRAPLFEEDLYVVELARRDGRPVPTGAKATPVPPLAERVYRALVLGTRDYVEKNGFAGVVLGLSGGIDSALTLAIAVDALGPARVHAVMMPSRYTSRRAGRGSASGRTSAPRRNRRPARTGCCWSTTTSCCRVTSSTSSSTSPRPTASSSPSPPTRSPRTRLGP